MEAKQIPLYGVELSLNDKFETKNYPNWIHICVNRSNICFQKEACINLIVKQLPSHFTKVAWIDHDLIFENVNWYKEASHLLECYKAVQLFSEHNQIDELGGMGKDRIGLVKYVSDTSSEIGRDPNEVKIGMPGCAWAARREMWDMCDGLYPFCFLGGGDTLFAHTILQITETERFYDITGLKTRVYAPYLEWKKKILNYISRNHVFYVNGKIFHMWHGDHKDRKYLSRYDLVNSLNYETLISVEDTGLIKLNSFENEVYSNIFGYFQSRREDG